MKAKRKRDALIFAYGSNMNERQMAFRCPRALSLGVARLPDYRLVFTGQSSRWGGGVANIEPARRSSVTGVLWYVSAPDLERLDAFEGFPYVYDRTPVLVDRGGRDGSLWCHAYVKSAADAHAAPSEEYLRAILDGYRTAGAAVPSRLRRLYGQVCGGLAA